MDARVFVDFLRMLVALRTADLTLSRNAEDDYQFLAGRISGFIAGLSAAGLINLVEEGRMRSLFLSANSHSCKPFPTLHNAGPHISRWDLEHRAEQAQEVVYVGPVEVPVQAASEGLHVRRVLGASRVRKAVPVSVSCASLPRLSPFWSPFLPRWALDSDTRALLHAARTQREATEVLACDLRLGAPDSARADTRTTY